MSYLKSASSNLFICKFSSKNKKNFVTKNALCVTLDWNVEKNTCNQRPPIYLMAKFRAKIRILKFGTKDGLFGWFG